MITILLAVYNGEKYLSEQIDSILNQTVNDCKIIIRDDGSSDNSVNIIDEYLKKFPEQITAIGGEPTGSAIGNFSELLKNCDDDYIMFADQDDVWLPDKAQKSLDAMLNAENGNSGTPVLVHGDLTVTDDKLNIIAKSFFEYQKIIPNDLLVNRLLAQNYVTGCTVMINRALKNRALPIPKDAPMHDWWLALVAACFGKIVTLKSPLIYYRQHGDNQVGAKSGSGISFISRKLKTIGTVRDNYNATYRQADLLLKSYGDILPDDLKSIIAEYTKMKDYGRFKKIKTIKRYGFKKSTKLRVLGQYILA